MAVKKAGIIGTLLVLIALVGWRAQPTWIEISETHLFSGYFIIHDRLSQVMGMGAYNQDSNAPSGGIPSHQLPEIASYSAFMRANLTYLGMYVFYCWACGSERPRYWPIGLRIESPQPLRAGNIQPSAGGNKNLPDAWKKPNQGIGGRTSPRRLWARHVCGNPTALVTTVRRLDNAGNSRTMLHPNRSVTG